MEPLAGPFSLSEAAQLPSGAVSGLSQLGPGALAELAQLGSGVALARPFGLLALVLPLALFLLARRKRRPPVLATGTFALWRQVTSAARPSAARRAGAPPAVWLAILALSLGAVALAGPRPVFEEPPRRWTVVVDRSPSMALPLAPGRPGTRRDTALALLADELGRVAGPRDRVRWTARGRESLDLPPDALPPRAWLEAPAWFQAEPDWRLSDEPGTFWLTDAPPEEEALFAGCVASGGELVPGPIGSDGTTLLEWDGVQLRRRPGPARRVAVVSAEGVRDAFLADLLAAWAAERGFGFGRSAEGGASVPALVLELGAGDGDVVPFRAGGRWRITGRAGSAGVLPALESGAVWLIGTDPAGAEIPLVVGEPGRVRVAWVESEPPGGDAAALAVAWSRLFEAWVLPAPEVVPLDERRAVGPRTVRAASPAAPVAAAPRPPGYDAWLACAAALAALAAASTASGVVLRPGASPGS